MIVAAMGDCQLDDKLLKLWHRRFDEKRFAFTNYAIKSESSGRANDTIKSSSSNVSPLNSSEGAVNVN